MVRAWAVVTGASSGIGEAFARRLAEEQGLGLVLAARRRDRLEALAAELGAASVRVVATDLAGEEGRAQLWRTVEELREPVELLVNNAGFGVHGGAASSNRDRQLRMLQLNCVALADLSLRYLELSGRPAAHEAGIINVASVVGLWPMAYMALYAASKSFVVSFCRALSEEMAPHGVRVLALCPGPVPTEFQRVAGRELTRSSSRLAISATQVADEGLAALRRGERVWVPGTAMRWVARALTLLPPALTAKASARARRG